MRDKTEQILKAALQVFARKGYNESTTLEIAGEAQVAEKTIFRKFKTKQNLFITTIQSILINKFDKILLQCVQQEDTEQFMFDLLYDRLMAISNHHKIIKTMLAESLMGNLEQQIDLPSIMFRTIQTAMDQHFSNKKSLNANTDHLVRVFSGLLVSYLVWTSPVPFHKMPEEERINLTKKYVQILQSCWEDGA